MLPQSVRSAASVLLVVLLGLLGAGAARADVRGDVQVGVRASVQADTKADLQADVQTSPTGECPRTITAPQVSKDRQPLVLVHGWTGTASGWDTTIQGLKQRLPDNFDYLTFDYSSANTDWAAGWIVWHEVPSAGGPVLTVIRYVQPKQRTAVTGPAAGLVFTAQGRAQAGATQIDVAPSDAATPARCVRVGVTGQSRIEQGAC